MDISGTILDWAHEVAEAADSQLLNGQYRISSTKKLARKLRPQDFGVVRLSEVGTFDSFGISVVQASRPAVSKFQITSTQGSGKLLDAICAAVMEAAERDAAAFMPDGILATAEDIQNYAGMPAIDLSMFYTAAKRNEEILWVPCRNLCSRESFMAPASLFHFPVSQGALISHPNTTGLAAGTSILEASMYAVFEVIERFFVSLAYKGYLRPKKIVGNFSAFSTNMIRQLEEKSYQVSLFSIGPAPIPVVLGVIRDASNLTNGAAYRTSASHINLNKAIDAVTKSLAQTVVTAIQGSREDLWRIADDLGIDEGTSKQMWESLHHLYDEEVDISKLLEPPLTADTMMALAVHTISTVCEYFGCEPYVRNLTRHASAKIVRVVFPPLVDGVIEPDRFDRAMKYFDIE